MAEYEKNYEFKIIKGMSLNDCHIHISKWGDGKEHGVKNFMEQLERYRTDFKITNMNIVCISSFYGNNDASQNVLAALLKLEYPEYYVCGGLVYHTRPVVLPFPEGCSTEEQLEDMMAIGLDGMKMIETKPSSQKRLGIKLSDSMYEPYFKKLEEEQIPVLCHASDPENFWNKGSVDPKHPDWNYAGEGYMSYEEIHRDIYNVLEKHPDLKITMAHILFLENYPEKFVELLETYPNLTYDICPHTYMFGKMSKDVPLWREIFTKYSDRILFGSDYSSVRGNIATIGHDNIYRFLLTEDEYEFWNGMKACGLGLQKTDVEKILYSNFYKVFGEKPKAINKMALRDYIRKYNVSELGNREVAEICEKHGLL